MNTCHACAPQTRLFIGLGLMALMLATRFHHFGDALYLPDASWAIFFLAGFYLPVAWLAGLMLAAVGIDLVAVGWMGASGYCLTPAYAALQAAHVALWAGGRWAGRCSGSGVTAVLPMAAIGLGGTLLAFTLSNGAFYWFGGRVLDTQWPQFLQTFVDYGPRFLIGTLGYLAVAALVHLLLASRGHAGSAAGQV